MLRILANLAKNHPELLGYNSLISKMVKRFQHGQINIEEARFLQGLVRQAPTERPIIEIGTLFGTSTKEIAIAKQTDTPLITVDNYSWNPFHIDADTHFEITSSILQNAINQFNIHQVRMDKSDFYTSYDGKPPGLVFLDAMHTFKDTKKDIEWAQSVKAAIICGHDYDEEEWPGVVEAVNACGGARQTVGTLYVMNSLP